MRKSLAVSILLAAPLFGQDVDIGGFCKGALIGPRTVLTAAHCLRPLNERPVRVMRGERVAEYVPGTAIVQESCADIATIEVKGNLGLPEPIGPTNTRRRSFLWPKKRGRYRRGESGSPHRSSGVIVGVLSSYPAYEPRIGTFGSLRPCLEALTRSAR